MGQRSKRRFRHSSRHCQQRWELPFGSPISAVSDKSEVHAARLSGEAAARLMLQHVDEEEEQQARNCLRKVEQRRERLGLARSEGIRRHTYSGPSVLIGRDLGEDLEKTWV